MYMYTFVQTCCPPPPPLPKVCKKQLNCTFLDEAENITQGGPTILQVKKKHD